MHQSEICAGIVAPVTVIQSRSGFINFLSGSMELPFKQDIDCVLGASPVTSVNVMSLPVLFASAYFRRNFAFVHRQYLADIVIHPVSGEAP